MDLDEVAHDEPPQQDLRCLQMQLFSFPVLKILICLSRHTSVVRPASSRFLRIP